MSFEEWIRKRWYIPLMIIFLVGASMQLLADVFGISILGRFGAILGGLVALGVSYVLFKIAR